MSGTISVSVYRCNVTGGFQLSIDEVDERGAGHGYRIFGPKFMADSTLLRSYTLTARDAAEIRRYIDKVPAPGSDTESGER